VDGNGIWHTREFGCASHVGVQFDLPTIGVAKTTFNVDGTGREQIAKQCKGNLETAPAHVNIIGDSGKVWGAALRSTKESTNPIYVSIGHRISLETSLKIVIMCITKFRIPEPIRAADGRSREHVRKIYDFVKK
jgi:deoxyinosine 3'endonuclease (endonuclease V)